MFLKIVCIYMVAMILRDQHSFEKAIMLYGVRRSMILEIGNMREFRIRLLQQERIFRK